WQIMLHLLVVPLLVITATTGSAAYAMFRRKVM
ncbi:hypothetical protein, partial [Escherichia coli]